MPPVFAHGRLRLYLLKLLDEAPRHGYEVIRLLEERFHGLYAPSAGTVYPRLAKLEAEGLVTHTTEGGRKVYSLTDAGRAELADRGGELADLELEIRDSVAELAAEIREDVRGSASDLRRAMREAAAQARTTGSAGTDGRSTGRDHPTGTDSTTSKDSTDSRGGRGGKAPWEGGPWTDSEAWRQAKEELRRAKEEWKEQARRAKEESRRAKQDAQRARKEAKDARDFAREEVERIAHRVQEQTQEHLRTGDWQGALREGLSEVTRAMTRMTQSDHPWATSTDPASDDAITVERADDARPQSNTATGSTPPPGTASFGKAAPGSAGPGTASDDAAGADAASDGEAGRWPEWATVDDDTSTDPARDLERLLDRFRDGVRDAARDHGVTATQLAAIRRQLAIASAHVDGELRRGRNG
ncbi:PadR family transcriptional regulator [Streptomyces zagrosensis]|uniref:DNA-binding PadR family transcriptional regulator/vacuolar-type H+-ATPase subunit H n=1 Tax=Streptomyces zagrosensis TaxID=1042984 RepID=A0A7W9QB46_9ACTN|nr:PadR family transcriptional regulator [Streptomyces zagrosensis]MBB5936905.1 DNA-binding PadR family transcriptional regulator/vacuolar-type H+-ATPase subunit H [Streptomyces zagrosensis]